MLLLLLFLLLLFVIVIIQCYYYYCHYLILLKVPLLETCLQYERFSCCNCVKLKARIPTPAFVTPQQSIKSRLVRFLTKFAMYFTPTFVSLEWDDKINDFKFFKNGAILAIPSLLISQFLRSSVFNCVSLLAIVVTPLSANF